MLLERELRILQREKLKRLEFEKQMAHYRRNPDLWLTERFGEPLSSIKWDEHPEYKTHAWDGDPNPFYTAWKYLAFGNWVALPSATGTGKTYILARIVLWFLDVYPNSLVVTSAPKKEQLNLQLWAEIGLAYPKFQRIRPYSKLTKLRLRVDAREGEEENLDSWQAVGFVAGVKASEESTTRAQGFHRKHMLIITEETPGMPLPTLTAFENTSTGGHNLIFAVGNPDNITDTLAQFGRNPKVKSLRVSGFDHPNVVTKRDIIPGAVSIGSIAMREQKFGKESNMYRSRVRGIAPDQAVDSLIKYLWLKWCCPLFEEYHKMGEIPMDHKSSNALGVDVANSFEGDMASLAWGQQNKLVELHEFICPVAGDIAFNVVYDEQRLEEEKRVIYHTSKLHTYGVMPENVGIDAVGVGSGTVNTFRGFPLNMEVVALQGGQYKEALLKDQEDKPLYEYVNLRSQMIHNFGLAVQNREIILDFRTVKEFDEFAKEAVLVTYTSKGGKIAITAKDIIKKKMGGKSPNKFDSAVYWNWMRQNFYTTTAPMLPLWGGGE